MILGLALSPAGSVVTAAFSRPFAVLLGEASYSLYLLHIPVWLLFTTFVPSPGLSLYAVYFVLLVGISIAAFKFIELPLRVHILAAYDRMRLR